MEKINNKRLSEEEKDSINYSLNLFLYPERNNVIESELIELGQKACIEDLSGLEMPSCFMELIRGTYSVYDLFKFDNEDEEMKKEGIHRLYSILGVVSEDCDTFKSSHKLFENMLDKLDELIQKKDFNRLIISNCVTIKEKIKTVLDGLSSNKEKYNREALPSEVITVCKKLFDLDNANYEKDNQEDINKQISEKKYELLRDVNINPTENYSFLRDLIKEKTEIMYDKTYWLDENSNKKVR